MLPPSRGDPAAPAAILQDAQDDFQQIAKEMHVHSDDPIDNEIPYIYEQAAEIVNTIIVSVSGVNSTTSNLEMVAELDSTFLIIEKQFLKRMENLMNKLASKVEDLQNELETHNLDYNNELSQLPGIFEKSIESIKIKHQQQIEEAQKEFDNRLHTHQERQAIITKDYEYDYLRQVEGEEAVWKRKIKELEQEFENLEKDLKAKINKKQQFTQLKNVELGQKATEYRQKEAEFKEDLKDMIRLKQKELENLKKELETAIELTEFENNNLKEIQKQQHTKLKKKEDELVKKYTKEYNDQMFVLDEETRKCIKIQQDIDNIQLDHDYQVKESKKSTEQKIRDAQIETNRIVITNVAAVTAEYQPKILSLTQELQVLEHQRSVSLEELRKASLVTTEECELKIIELNNKHQKKRSKLQMVLRKEKDELQLLLDKRGKTIDDLKTDFNKQISTMQEELRSGEENHANKIRKILEMYKYEREQIENRRIKNMETLNKRLEETKQILKEEHDQRMTAITYRMDMQQKMEMERAYAQGVAEANEQCSKELADIKEKIKTYQSSIMVIENEMEALYKKHAEEYKEYSDLKNAEFEERKQLIESQNVIEINEMIATRDGLKEKIEIMKKKIEKLDKETKEYEKHKIIKPEDLAIAGDPVFAEKLQEQQNIIAKAKKREKELEREIKQMTVRFETAKGITDDLQAELNEFNRHFDSGVEEKLIDRKFVLEKELNEVKQNLNKFSDKCDKERQDLEKQLEFIIEKHKNAEERYKNALEYSQLDTAQKLKEAEKEPLKRFEEEDAEMERKHKEDLEAMRRRVEELKLERQQNLDKYRKEYEADLENAQGQFKDAMKNLESQQEEALRQVSSLLSRLNEERAKQCPACKAKEEELARIKAKREELQENLDDLIKHSQVSNQKMTNVLSQQPTVIKKQQSSGNLAVTQPTKKSISTLGSKPQQGSKTIARPKSARRTSLAPSTPR